MIRTLSVDDIELIYLQIIDASGGSNGTRDRGRLESVVATQTQSVFGEELFPSIFQKAAAITRGIISDHPFIDGNKRTGIMSALILLELNGIKTKIEDKKLEDFAVDITVKNLLIEQIASWLQSHSATLD
jgi:death-on-curing protein